MIIFEMVAREICKDDGLNFCYLDSSQCIQLKEKPARITGKEKHLFMSPALSAHVVCSSLS